ncbi:MAG: hypothetical protein WBD20_20190 [Pirellulaceae bacterium]
MDACRVSLTQLAVDGQTPLNFTFLRMPSMFSSDSSQSTNQQSAETATSEEIHTGYDYESGFLMRARQWTDLLPWLRLVRVMRVAGSPPLVLLVAITFAVWFSGHVNFFRDSVSSGLSAKAIEKSLASRDTLAVLPRYIQLMIPTDVFQLESRGSWWEPFAAMLWSLLIWLPTTLLLMRQGGLLTAGRPMMGFVDAGKFAIRRSPYALVIAFVPLLCVLFICLALAVLGWVSRAGDWIAYPLSILTAIIALACGLLAFGANIATPLGWAALANEKEPDPLDALSRGYEYLYRRPLQLVIHGLAGMVILFVVTTLAALVAVSAVNVSNYALALSGAPKETIVSTALMLSFFPSVVAVTLFWSIVGGVYLLMRYDANGQEVEDIWQSPLVSETALPELSK